MTKEKKKPNKTRKNNSRSTMITEIPSGYKYFATYPSKGVSEYFAKWRQEQGWPTIVVERGTWPFKKYEHYIIPKQARGSTNPKKVTDAKKTGKIVAGVAIATAVGFAIYYLTKKEALPRRCTTGETACVNSDLYTCVGTDKWELTQKDSPLCKIPPPDEWKDWNEELGREAFSVSITGVVNDWKDWNEELGRKSFSVNITELPTEYTLTTLIDPITAAGGVVKDPLKDTYSYGEWVKLTAVTLPPHDWHFTYWEWEGEFYSGNPVTIIVTHNITVIAHFSR